MDPAAATPRPAHTPAPAPPAGESAAPDRRQPKRHVKNYLLDTGLQLKLASYLLAFAVALSLGLGWHLWTAYRETSAVVALSEPEVAAALASEDKWRIVQVSVILVLVLLCLLGASVVITHRIAGPAFVIRRTCTQVANGNLSRPRPLRNHDLLVDLADAVAGMVDAIRDREGIDAAAMRAAVAALRDPSSSPDVRAAAAAELERLASEKEARLKA
jgi:HAMP domain-containing protein